MGEIPQSSKSQVASQRDKNRNATMKRVGIAAVICVLVGVVTVVILLFVFNKGRAESVREGMFNDAGTLEIEDSNVNGIVTFKFDLQLKAPIAQEISEYTIYGLGSETYRGFCAPFILGAIVKVEGYDKACSPVKFEVNMHKKFSKYLAMICEKKEVDKKNYVNLIYIAPSKKTPNKANYYKLKVQLKSHPDYLLFKNQSHIEEKAITVECNKVAQALDSLVSDVDASGFIHNNWLVNMEYYRDCTITQKPCPFYVAVLMVYKVDQGLVVQSYSTIWNATQSKKFQFVGITIEKGKEKIIFLKFDDKTVKNQVKLEYDYLGIEGNELALENVSKDHEAAFGVKYVVPPKAAKE